MKTITSLVLSAATLISILPVRAFSIDLDYGADSRDLKRGDYYISHATAQRGSAQYAWARNRMPLKKNRQMTLVPTCYYKGKDGVIAYNYRPVFVRGLHNGPGVRAETNTRLRPTERATKPVQVTPGVTFRTEVPYRLYEPAVTPNRIGTYRTLYANPNLQVVKEQPVRELPPIGESTVGDY